jgi:hypothetical protein
MPPGDVDQRIGNDVERAELAVVVDAEVALRLLTGTRTQVPNEPTGVDLNHEKLSRRFLSEQIDAKSWNLGERGSGFDRKCNHVQLDAQFDRIALAEDIPGTFDVIRDINDRYDFETLIAGHVGRPGTKADVEMQIEFMTDLHNAAATALGSVTPGEGVDPADFVNPWALFDNYIDRVVVECVNTLTPKWQDKMSAFDVFIYDQCLAMEQSIRVDGPSL